MAGACLLVAVVLAACAPARAAIACQGFNQRFCKLGCGFQTVQEVCCRCYDDCCPPPADDAPTAKLSLPPGGKPYGSYDGGCVDNAGVPRPAGSQWYDNNDHPCRKFTCAGGVVVTLFDHSGSCGQDKPHCPYTWPAGKCCRVYNCPTGPHPPSPPSPPSPPTPPVVGRPCYDELNQLHGDGEVWTTPGQPCVQYHCENGLVVTSAVGCPPPPPGCVAGAVTPGECCPSVSCHPPPTPPPSTDCTYRGVTYTSGQHFPDDPLHPCQQKVCEHGLVVSLGAPQHCAEPACANPVWPAGECCRKCPAGRDTPSLDKLKNAVRQLAQHLELGQAQLDQLEDSLQQLITSLGGLIQGNGDTSIEYLVKNVVYLLNILGVPSSGHPSSHINVLLNQLQHQLVALVDQLGSSLTSVQISNAKIDISDFIEWLRSYDSSNPTAGAGILLVDLATLFTGILPQTGFATPNLDKLSDAVHKLAQHLGLGQAQLNQLEDSLQQLITSLGGLIQGTGDTTIEYLLKNIIYLLNILGVPSTGNPGGDLHALVNQLEHQLVALVNQLGSSLTDDQISNAKIDIREFIQWLVSYDGSNPSNSAGILLIDLATLFTGILPQAGCTDAAGTVHQPNTVYVDNPASPQYCYVCAKSTAGVGPLLVLDITKSCGTPPPGCTSRVVPNNCCPVVDCKPGEAPCRDPNGGLHEHGSTYVDDPVRPCITYRCTDGVIKVVDKITCMDVPEGCTSWLMNGRCCPKSDCPADDCVYDGRERDHGTSWPQDPTRPCIILTCLNGDVTSEDLTSLCPPPPQPHCLKRHVTYQCCPAYDCVTVNCTYNDVVYTEGQTWPDDPVYPCKRFKCTRSGTEKVEDQTPHCPPQPHPRCQGQRQPYQCCKQWDCPECTQNGTTHPEGDVWWDNPARRCVKYTCRQGVVLQLDNLLPCREVPFGCKPNFKGTECCHFKYTCPFCMFDPLGQLIRKVGTSLG